MLVNTDQAVEHLLGGGLLIYPTDTVYGLGCLTTTQAIQSLLTIKPRESGFIILVDDIQHYLDWIDEPFSLPVTDRPTTWVLKASKKAPICIQNKGNIAIREVSHEPTKSLVKQLGSPLISTSANYPGQKTPSTPQEIMTVFDLPILSGDNGNQKPSRIIHYKSGTIIRP